MYKNKKVLAIITARGGSQRLPSKNILPLAGKPLIGWSIEVAKKSLLIDKVMVSSDCDEIISIAEQFGAEIPFKRPDNLATATTSGIAPVKHACQFFEDKQEFYDIVVLLQPTSPFRRVEDIDNAVKLLIDNETQIDSVVSLVEPDKKVGWYYYIDNEKSNKLENVLDKNNSSDRKKAYCLNGAVYVIKKEKLLDESCTSFVDENTLGYVMPKEYSLDIDSELDFKFCQLLLREGIIKNDD